MPEPPILTRLAEAKFTGVLELHYDRGVIVSAELKHWIVATEFSAVISVVEEKGKE